MNYILGGGITGLIFAFYNQKYKIITEDLGGQMSSQFTLGPRYLHKTPSAKAFLFELRVPTSERKVKVGYIDDSGWVKSPDTEFRQKYFMKSRNKTTLEGFDPTVMNSNKDVFDVLDVDFSLLIEKLVSSIDKKSIIQSRVSSVDTEHKLITLADNKELYYNHLVSSIPLNVFTNIMTNDHKIKNKDYESFHMTYCLVEPTDVFNVSDFDFVYDARSTTRSHRMTKDNNGVVLDYFGHVEKEDLRLGSIYKDHRTLWNCQIVSRDDEPHIKDVKFVGRYGTWNRSWKTEKVIDEAIIFYDKNVNK